MKPDLLLVYKINKSLNNLHLDDLTNHNKF
ncbi:hypothetical protein JT066_07690 [Helicobacter pylori]|nr:hypothetical protein [Helicobacter pylori]